MLPHKRISIFEPPGVSYYNIWSLFILFHKFQNSIQSTYERTNFSYKDHINDLSTGRHITYQHTSCSEMDPITLGLFDDLGNPNANNCSINTNMNELYHKHKAIANKYNLSMDLRIFPISSECPENIFDSDSSSNKTFTKRKMADNTPDNDSNNIDNMFNGFNNNSIPKHLNNQVKKRKTGSIVDGEKTSSSKYKFHIKSCTNEETKLPVEIGYSDFQGNFTKISDQKGFNGNIRRKLSVSKAKHSEKNKKYQARSKPRKKVSVNDEPISVVNITSTTKKEINTDIINTSLEPLNVAEEEIEYIPTVNNTWFNSVVNIEENIREFNIVNYTKKVGGSREKDVINTITGEEIASCITISIIEVLSQNTSKTVVYIISNIPKYLIPIFRPHDAVTHSQKYASSKLHNFSFNISVVAVCNIAYDIKVGDLIPILKYNTDEKFWKAKYTTIIYKWEYNRKNSARKRKFVDIESPDNNFTETNIITNDSTKWEKQVSKQIRSFLGINQYKRKCLDHLKTIENPIILEIVKKLSKFQAHIISFDKLVNSPNNMKHSVKKICDFRTEFLFGKLHVMSGAPLNDIEEEIVRVYEVIYENFQKLSKSFILSYNIYLRETEEPKIYYFDV